MKKKRKQRREKRKEERVGKKRKGEKMGKKIQTWIFPGRKIKGNL
jgi:hypothetical protein